jgi:hypothetical protein
MACTGDTKPGYCKVYATNPPVQGGGTPVVTPPSEDKPIPVESDGGIGDTPHQGFFEHFWNSIKAWFSHLF